jgi:hypothetical protein
MQQKPGVTPTTNGEHPHDEDPAADNNFVTDASTQVPPQMHTSMNGGMPPQQVYVENNMNGLETQFQSLGMGDDGVKGHDDSQDPEDTELDEVNDEVGEGEDDPLKLFVGQVRACQLDAKQ